MSGRKKSRAPLGLHALRKAVRFPPSSVHPSSLQDLPLAPSVVDPPAPVVVVVVIPAPPPPPVAPFQKIAQTVEVDAPTASAGLVVVPLSTFVAPLLSAGVATMSTLVMPPPPSSVPRIPPSVVLASASTSSFFRPMFP